MVAHASSCRKEGDWSTGGRIALAGLVSLLETGSGIPPHYPKRSGLAVGRSHYARDYGFYMDDCSVHLIRVFEHRVWVIWTLDHNADRDGVSQLIKFVVPTVCAACEEPMRGVLRCMGSGCHWHCIPMTVRHDA